MSKIYHKYNGRSSKRKHEYVIRTSNKVYYVRHENRLKAKMRARKICKILSNMQETYDHIRQNLGIK